MKMFELQTLIATYTKYGIKIMLKYFLIYTNYTPMNSKLTTGT